MERTVRLFILDLRERTQGKGEKASVSDNGGDVGISEPTEDVILGCGREFITNSLFG